VDYSLKIRKHEWGKMKAIIEAINAKYDIEAKEIIPIRDMIGVVFLVISEKGKYLLKLYKSSQIFDVVNTFDIIDHLYNDHANNLTILKTKFFQNRFTVVYDDKPYIGIIMTYVEGEHPTREEDFEEIIKMMKNIHLRMNHYPKYLPYLGKKFYISRFVKLLLELKYDKEKSKDLETWGTEFFKYIDEAPRSFCHGDFHTENLIKDAQGELTLLDFDASSHTTYLVDIATFCDMTNFNHLEKDQFQKTLDQISVCQELYHDFPDREWKIMMAFIPVRHLELIATIAKARGNEEISQAFLDQQYDWIKQYRELFIEWLNR